MQPLEEGLPVGRRGAHQSLRAGRVRRRRVERDEDAVRHAHREEEEQLLLVGRVEHARVEIFRAKEQLVDLIVVEGNAVPSLPCVDGEQVGAARQHGAPERSLDGDVGEATRANEEHHVEAELVVHGRGGRFAVDVLLLLVDRAVRRQRVRHVPSLA